MSKKVKEIQDYLEEKDKTREWFINLHIIDDLPKGISPRDAEDIEEIMESCCNFITEQFLNLKVAYRILGVHVHDRR